MEQYRLGKLPVKKDKRTLQFKNYITRALALKPQVSVNWRKNIYWPMYGNDYCGDCTVAAAGHSIENWTVNESGEPLIFNDNVIIDAYKAVSGWNGVINDPTDTGAYLLDVLNYWRTTGIGGDKITAYTQVNPLNTNHVKLATYIFGGLYIGLLLPYKIGKKTIFEANTWVGGPNIWKDDTQPGSAGGHCVPVIAYNSMYLTVVTWAKVVRMSWLFLRNYCDEMYAVLSPDWNTDGTSPSGFSWTQLQEDLATVTN